MTVVLNEGAINRLFTSIPFVREAVDRQAELARDALQFRIDGIISNPAVRPQAGIKITPEGAEVGIVDTFGRVDNYMDYKLGVLEPWWEDVGEAAARGA